MPVKRAIMITVREGILTYALRVDAAEPGRRLPTYHSSYNDPNDPDLQAIREGRVLEQIRKTSVLPQGNENKAAVQARVQNQIRQEWQLLDRKVTDTLSSSALAGRYWDGSNWKDLATPPAE